MIPVIDAIVGVIGKGLDKWIPDAAQRDQVAVELAKLTYKQVELEIQDRASARAREMEVKDQIPGILAISFTVGLFGGAIWFNAHPPTQDGKVVVEMLMSALRDGWLMAVAYYYGAMNRQGGK